MKILISDPLSESGLTLLKKSGLLKFRVPERVNFIDPNSIALAVIRLDGYLLDDQLDEIKNIKNINSVIQIDTNYSLN